MKMVAVAPTCKAFADVIATDNRPHSDTVKLPVPVAQQFGGFVPETVANIPVVAGVAPHGLLIKIVPVTGVAVSLLMLSDIPVISVPAGMRTELSRKAELDVPRPSQPPLGMVGAAK